MKKFNYIRTGAANIQLKVADCHHNKNEIKSTIEKANQFGIQILAFPELSITGYTCGDLFFQKILTDETENAIREIADYSKDFEMLIVVGAPIVVEGITYNCAVVINQGKVIGIVPKTFLPNYNEFYEKRWFASGKKCTSKSIKYCGFDVNIGTDLIFRCENLEELIVGIEICEDLWAPIPPSSALSIGGATVILNLSASNDLVGKGDYRTNLVVNQSARCIAGYVYASAGYGESSTDLVFAGHCLISENGKLLKESSKYLFQGELICADIDLDIIVHDRRQNNTFHDSEKGTFRPVFFSIHEKNEDIQRVFNPHPFVPSDYDERTRRCEEIFNIQVNGLAKRLDHIHSNKMIIGISGGLDSTLALLVAVKTCDKMKINRRDVLAVTMPGFGTTDRTYNNAVGLIQSLGTSFKEISIKEACLLHFKDIGHDINTYDVTYENSQARERTQVLMDLANQIQGIVIGTGDLSELAMGWATYNGDHMSMYGVNSGVPKTLVRYVVEWVAENDSDDRTRGLLMDVLDTPVSPELLPPDKDGNISQKTEDLIGPYELHDFFLYNTVRFGFGPQKMYLIACRAFADIYSPEYIKKWLENFYRRFISQQFKRSCLPDGPKVGSICLSPRGDWRMPSDASMALWMKELQKK
jgi:NAD+ synthase (glutamine-hydrolysing)